MGKPHLTKQHLLLACCALIAWSLASHVSAYAETYIGGQFGVTFPGNLSNGQVTTPGFGALTLSDQELSNSLMWGLKAGHYFTALRWFGVEAEFFYTTPHVKQQPLTFKGPGGNAIVDSQGLYHRVMTFAPINLMFRYHKTRLQPYFGIGPGIFFARIKDPAITSGDNSQSSNGKLGLNMQVGARYYITRRWAAFGEYKFNYARFDYKDTPNLFGFKADYSAHIFGFGISYHF
ncbi:MAG: outer membrane protein [Nitrospiraceae bacterium]